jgi:hypothetical protein
LEQVKQTAGSESRTVSSIGALRHLVVFQFKLALDALRDLLLSPLSIAVFVLDVLLKPTEEASLYAKLMALGRRSDRLINLFDEFDDDEHYTVDQTLNSVENAVKPHWKEVRRRGRRERLSDDAGGDSA